MRSLLPQSTVLLATLILVNAASLDAYDFQTHEQITARGFDAAFEASQTQGLQQYLNAVGISLTDTFTVERPSPPGQLDGFLNTGSIPDWMREGALETKTHRAVPRASCFGWWPIEEM